MPRRRCLRLALGALAVALLATGSASAHHQHGTDQGHLTGSGAWGKLAFVGKLEVTTTENTVADVAADPRGTWAYLANWGRPDCAENSEAGGMNNPDGGAWVIDISDPANPVQRAFIPHSQDSAPGEGMQAVNISTPRYSGTMLVMNNEQCGKNGKGGVSLYDVTNPLKPVKLSEHFGDQGFADTNDIHSAFAWDAGDKAYVVMTDNAEATDLDILDITNPKRPVLIADLNLNTLAVAQTGDRIDQPEIGVTESSLHDMIVKKIGGKFVMLVSYWDGGYVQLDVTDPTNARYISDTDFTNPDPELLESAGIALPPEGNAHQAEFTADNRYFLAADEDFSPYRAPFKIETGPNAGEYPGGEFGWTPPVQKLSDGKLNGPTVFGGYGCPDDRATIPAASTVREQFAARGRPLQAGEELIAVFSRGPVEDPSHNHEACYFSEKVESGQLAGYDAVIIANHHVGAQAGDAPDAQICGSAGHVFTPTVPAICVGHRAMHLLFNDEPNYEVPYAGSEPAIGALGEDASVIPAFDGWGYVHLYDAATAAELDTYAIEEAHDPAFASGFGDLSVHEVATHPTRSDLAFLSYYAGGMRALQVKDGKLVEIGGYLDPVGNDFWGVETFVRDRTTYVLGSDMDSGLWIFKYTGR